MLSLGAALLLPAPAFDVPAEAGAAGSADVEDAAEKKDERKDEKGGEAAASDGKAAAGDADAKWDPYEDPGKAYHFVGLRFRDVIVPKFMVNIFADGGATVNVPMFGAEYSRRKDGNEIDISIQYADYSMDPFLFKGKSDGEEAFERVSSDLKMILVQFDLLYEVIKEKKGRFSFLVGGGVGIGGVFGNLYRNQVFPNVAGASADEPSQWTNCPAPSQLPAAPNGAPYCDAGNNHYGSYAEPSWANGGSKPFIFPWISLPQLSFRYKPIKQLQTRLDTGFSISGFFFGLTASYGL